MSKDSSNNNDLKDFLIDENPEEVEKRIKNDEKNSISDESPGPWDKKNTVNEKKDNSSSIKNNKKPSASKNYFILILIVCAGLGFIIYQANNNESLVKKKDEKKVQLKNYLLEDYLQLDSVEIKNRISNIKILGEYTNTKVKFEEIHFSNGSWYHKKENEKEKFGTWKTIGNSICYTQDNKDNINSCVLIYTKKNNQKNIYFVDNKKEIIFAKSTSLSKNVRIDTDEKNESDNRKLIELHTSELWKVEFLANWSEHFTDTMIINLTNKTNYTIKELEFWFMDKKCSDFDSNSNDWTNKMQETFLVNFEPNQKLTIRKNDLDISKHWCYVLNKAKGY